MNISTITIAKPDITQLEINSVVDVLKSGMIACGEKVKAFEKRFANYIGVKHAIAVNSGTAALHCAYLAAGMSNSDSVLTTPLTFNATINMIKAVTNRSPMYIDIYNNFNMDETILKNFGLSDYKFIVPVHL